MMVAGERAPGQPHRWSVDDNLLPSSSMRPASSAPTPGRAGRTARPRRRCGGRGRTPALRRRRGRGSRRGGARLRGGGRGPCRMIAARRRPRSRVGPSACTAPSVRAAV